MNKKVECVSCLGTGEVMVAREGKKGFDYKPCTLCDSSGEIPEELAKDFILSLNEENLDDD